MAFSNHKTIEILPLHLVAGILECLSTIEQLSNTLLSHRLFYDAYNDGRGINRRPILRAIFLRQVPEPLLPYAVASFESRRLAGSRMKAFTTIDQYIGQMPFSSTSPVGIFFEWEKQRSDTSSVPMASASDYEYMCWEYAAIASLRRGMATELIPLINRYGLEHPTSLTSDESFRIDRAFYWYQMKCHLFATDPDPSLNLDARAFRRWDIGPSYSPWVEEQQKIAYHFLKRKVTNALDQIAVHDVTFDAREIIDTRSDYQRSDARPDEESDRKWPLIQWFLMRGLIFLSRLSQATDYDEKVKLLDLSTNIHASMDSDLFPSAQIEMCDAIRDTFEMYWQVEDLPLDCYFYSALAALQIETDGVQDALWSHSFRTWFRTHRRQEFYSCCYDPDAPNLWACAYVMWDFVGVPDPVLSQAMDKISQDPALLPSYRSQWTEEEIARSEKQKSDIRCLGGSGYWPMGGADFSKIQGLTESDKETLIGSWRNTGMVESSKRKRDASCH